MKKKAILVKNPVPGKHQQVVAKAETVLKLQNKNHIPDSIKYGRNAPK